MCTTCGCGSDDALVELELLRDAKNFAYGAEIGMIEGQCQMTRNRFAQAAAIFESIVKRFGENELADDAAAAFGDNHPVAAFAVEEVAGPQALDFVGGSGKWNALLGGRRN